MLENCGNITIIFCVLILQDTSGDVGGCIEPSIASLDEIMSGIVFCWSPS